jgi:hypothetical protein
MEENGGLPIEYERLTQERHPKLKKVQDRFLNIVKKKNDHIKEKTDVYHEWVKSQTGEDNQDELRQKIFANTYVYKELRAQTRMLMVFIVVCLIILGLSLIKSPYFDETAYGAIVGTLIALLFVYELYYAWDLSIRDPRNFDEYDFSRYGKGPQYTKENEEDKIPEPGCVERIAAHSVNKFFIDNYLPMGSIG